MSSGKDNSNEKQSQPADGVKQGETCLIAPQDYANYYSKAKEQANNTNGTGQANTAPADTKTNTPAVPPSNSKTSQKTSNQGGKTNKSKPRRSSSKKSGHRHSNSKHKRHSGGASEPRKNKSKSKKPIGRSNSRTKQNGSRPPPPPKEQPNPAQPPPPPPPTATATQAKETTKQANPDDFPTALIAPADYVNIYKEKDENR